MDNTKTVIEQTALDLFSKKGFRAVSIRDICKIVGIKESSVYYHFQNKQAIMDAIMEKIGTHIQVMKDRFAQAFAEVSQVSEDAMCEVAVHYLEHFFLNPYIYQVIQMLSIERMADRKADRTYRWLLFEMPFEQQEEVFTQMMERGIVQKQDAASLAQQYQAIILYAFFKYCIGAECTEEMLEQARAEVKKNILAYFKAVML